MPILHSYRVSSITVCTNYSTHSKHNSNKNQSLIRNYIHTYLTFPNEKHELTLKRIGSVFQCIYSSTQFNGS